MSKLKVSGNASGTGVITLEAPNTNTDRAITLPDAAGELINIAPSTSGNVLTSDGTDWTSAAAAGGGLYASVAIICDQKAANTVGGTFTSGAWRTRDLNTEISDDDGIVSISSNQFTLQAGTYTLDWMAAAYNVHVHKTRLANTTDSSYNYGMTAYVNDSGNDVVTYSDGSAVVTIGSAKVFEIQHQARVGRSTNGFGESNSLFNADVEKYCLVKILKHS